MKSTQHKLCDIIAGYLEYVTIEKRLGTLDMEKMELVYRRQEITKLQSEIIKELKTIDAKLDQNISQKCRLEKKENYNCYPSLNHQLHVFPNSTLQSLPLTNLSVKQLFKNHHLQHLVSSEKH